MRTLIGRSLVVLPLVALVGCASAGTPKRTQLQIREFQTRAYETTDVRMVMKAVLSVLQDEGYTVEEANADLGLVTATREEDIDSTSEKVAGWLLPFYGGNRSKTAILEVTGNVSSFGTQTKLRMNFHERILNQHGVIKTIRGIDDPVFYQNFFTLVDKAIFLLKEKVGLAIPLISPPPGTPAPELRAPTARSTSTDAYGSCPPASAGARRGRCDGSRGFAARVDV